VNRCIEELDKLINEDSIKSYETLRCKSTLWLTKCLRDSSLEVDVEKAEVCTWAAIFFSKYLLLIPVRNMVLR